MDSNITALLDRCKRVENTVNNIAVKYSALPDIKIQSDLGRLVNRAREYEHGTFIILVVGPAKSGKSTLVNLIAGEYVSPTSFLECTVRPSVISRREEGHDSSITVYSGTDNEAKLEQIDSIIDIIRGFGSEEDLAGVTREHLPLTKENIRDRVQLGLENSLDSENLLTSIRTEGGQLLQDRVFVIDMPGFDGAYQNIDNPVYETIAQRADLIIFVQSSNAAFSKVSKEFLNILAKNNKNVPVCLVHNVFDAAWWREEESKKADIEVQRDFACDKIREMGFNIDRHNSFCINLGAVEDYRKGIRDSRDKLAKADKEFSEMESRMYDSIITRRDSMRLNNALSRVAQQRDKIVERVQAGADRLRDLLDRYTAEARRLDTLKSALPIAAPELPKPDLSMIERTVLNECEVQSRGIHGEIKKSYSETEAFIGGIVKMINNSLNNELDQIFSIRRIEDELYNEYRNHFTTLESSLAGSPGIVRGTPGAKVELTIEEQFNVASHINIPNIVPVKKYLKVFNEKHTGYEIIEYIGVIKNQLAPTQLQGMIPDPGVIARHDVKNIEGAIREAVAEIVEQYNERLLAYYNATRETILKSILPDPAGTENKLQTLSDLCNDLKKLSI